MPQDTSHHQDFSNALIRRVLRDCPAQYGIRKLLTCGLLELGRMWKEDRERIVTEYGREMYDIIAGLEQAEHNVRA